MDRPYDSSQGGHQTPGNGPAEEARLRPAPRTTTSRAARALVLAASFGLGACSISGLGGGGPPPAADPFAGAAAANADAGPIVGNAPVTGEVLGGGSVKVALLLPLSATGNTGAVAQDIKNAAALAVNDFKNADIQVLVKDDRGTNDGGRAAASEAIAQGAELILGPLNAGAVNGASAVARGANVPVVAFSTDSTTASRSVYLLSFLPQPDVDRIVGYSASHGRRAIAALLPNNGYGTVVEAALHKAAADNGADLVGIVRYDLDRVSMQAKAKEVAAIAKTGRVNAIFVPDAGDAAPFIADILAAEGVRQPAIVLLGSAQWDDPRFLQSSNLNGALFPAPDRSGFAGFADKFRAAYGKAPARQASIGYDAISLAAGLTAGFGTQRFSSATLGKPQGFVGVDGVYRFNGDGTNQRALAVYTIDRGKTQIVDPAPSSFPGNGF